MLNERLLAEGYATEFVDTPPNRYATRFRAAATAAWKADRGLLVAVDVARAISTRAADASVSTTTVAVISAAASAPSARAGQGQPPLGHRPSAERCVLRPDPERRRLLRHDGRSDRRRLPGAHAWTEIVDIVDAHDRVIGTATRHEMRTGNLRHRAVGIVARRRPVRCSCTGGPTSKDVWPGGGTSPQAVCSPPGRGTTRQPSGSWRRQLGIVRERLTPLGAGAFADHSIDVLARRYRCDFDPSGGEPPIRFADGEVVDARWVDWLGLAALLATEAWCPDSLTIGLPLLLPVLRPDPARPAGPSRVAGAPVPSGARPRSATRCSDGARTAGTDRAMHVVSSVLACSSEPANYDPAR